MAQYDVVIVGAGIAGLCAALQLQNEGLQVLVCEASDAVGGRLRTDHHEGFLLDRGFQVLLTAYPEANNLLDYDELALKYFTAGAMVYGKKGFYKLLDPTRHPAALLGTMFNPITTVLDKIKIAALRNRHQRHSVEQLMQMPEQSAIGFLDEWQFSDSAIERFFRPFLGGIFLENQLHTSSRMLEFVLKMFAEGYAALPAKGMQAIAQQIADRLHPHTVRLQTAVSSIEPNRISLQTGEKISTRSILVATAAPQAAQLLAAYPHHIDTQANASRCVYFATDTPPLAAPLLLLNGTAEGLVNHVCVPSLVNPSYAPAGRHLISVSIVQPTAHLSDEQLLIQVRSELRRWFKKEVRYWEHLRTYTIPYALPQRHYLHATKPQQIQAVAPNIYVCGDHLTTPSLNGAMESARLTAEALSWSLALNK